MIYSNFNDMEHFYKFKMKKFGKGISKVGKGAIKTGGKIGKGAIKTGGKIGKGGLKVFDKINPLSVLSNTTNDIFGGGNSIMSYVSLGLCCLIIIAVIIFQLKN